MTDTVIQPRAGAHPLAGQRMSGARMIMQVLADEGVTAIFGYSGGAILPTYDAVFLYNQTAAAAQGAADPADRARPTSRAPDSWPPAMPVPPARSGSAS